MTFTHSTGSPDATQVRRPPTGVPDIAFDTHVFGNGLRLVVHEDRSTPRVAMEIRYDVGAKDEQAGYTGFAHLFEHLMFKGSANRPGGWHQAVLPLGATNVNGTTNYDRTNFFQTVPKAALDRVLWMEADRMGFVLDGVDAKSLADEIEVVKNEKRQISAGPGSETSQYLRDALYPRSHPYGHHVIGDEADLNAATLEMAAHWHQRWYGASNAVIALVGDIGLEEAIDKVGHWFGDLPAGPPLQRELRNLPLFNGLKHIRCQAQMPFRQVVQVWHCGGSSDPVGPLLGLAASVLGAAPRGRLWRRLVDQERLCRDVGVSHSSDLLCGLLQVQATLEPEAEIDRVDAIIVEELDRFRVEGPTLDELDEARRNVQRGYFNALESIEFKADILCANVLTFGSPDGNRYLMERTNCATPQDIGDAFARWCRPELQALRAEIVPFARGSTTASVDRSAPPPIGEVHAPVFPEVLEHKLDNGLRIRVAKRQSAPEVHCQLMFDGGTDIDPIGKEGLTRLALTLLSKTKKTRSVDAFDASLRSLRLGVGMATDQDTTSVFMSGPPEKIRQIMGHAAEFALQPAFLASEFEFHHAKMVAGERRTRSAAENGGRALNKYSFGFLREQSLAGVESITHADVVSRYRAWMDPAKSVLIVAGNVDLVEVVAAAREAFGDWVQQGPALPKNSREAVSAPGYYLVASPGEGQTSLSMRCLDGRLRTPIEVEAATVYAQCVQQRLSEKLRGSGWTYGVGCNVHMHPSIGFLQIGTSVQADRSLDSLQCIEEELRLAATSRPITQEEFDCVQSARILGLVNNWVSCQSIVGTIATNHALGRPGDYAATLEQRIRGVTLAAVHEVASWFVDKNRFVTVAYGDPKWLPSNRFTAVTEDDL